MSNQPPSPRSPSLVNRLLRAPVAAIAGFLVVSSIAGHFFPPPELPDTVREKAAYLSEHGDEYDAVFLGSSRIQNHIKPGLFDRFMASAGMPMKSFNFGVSSMHSPEDEYVLDLILARPRARLRWIFIEADFLNTTVKTDHAGTLRGVYWHDWPRFSLLCRCLAIANEKGLRRNILDAFRRGNDFLDHAHLFGQRSTNTGSGERILEGWLFGIPSNPMDWNALGIERDGWLPAVRNAKTEGERRSGRLRTILNERIAKPPSKETGDAASQKALANLLGRITRAGIKPVIVIAPHTREGYFYPEPALAARFPIIDLCDPARFPDLYREDLRVDLSHVDATGAEIFTRILADQFTRAIHKS